MGARKIQPGSGPFEYEFFSDFMKSHTGVHLPKNPKNEALVLNRVSKVVRLLNLKSFADLKDRLLQSDPVALVEFIGNLTTHKTHFFREEAHFAFLKNYLSSHFSKKSDLRIWCAAASSGQEPYTIALLLQETLGKQKLLTTRFLATDIDQQVLHQASQGFYLSSEMEGLTEDYKKKYFKPVVKGKKEGYLATNELRDWIHFAPLNLTQKDYGFKNKFDLIFCRNVLIYFDTETTHLVIDQLTSQLHVGGYLILGHSESGVVRNPRLKSESRAIFQRIK